MAGTEIGLYISFDDGENWKSFQLNLPVTPITDLQFHKREKELVVGTEGRAFCVLDDVPMLYQLNGFSGTGRCATVPAEGYVSLRRRRARRRRAVGGGRVGENPPGGAVVYYWLKARPQGEVTLEFLDAGGKVGKQVLHARSAASASRSGRRRRELRSAAAPPARLTAQAGLNRFVWNLRYPDATSFPGLIMWAGSTDWSARLARHVSRCS